MTQTYPIPGMPYRIDWAKFHPHNVALREAQRREAQDRAHDRRMARQADKDAERAKNVARMASPEMVARKAAALEAAQRLLAQLAPTSPRAVAL